MRLYQSLLIALLGLVFLLACGEKMTEEQMRAKALDFVNKEQWGESAKVMEKMLSVYKESPNTDETLYKLGEIYANNLKDFEKSVDMLQKILTDYPESDYTVQASFMIGYRYANDIKDFDQAKKTYEQFLKQWPDHELASSVQWELEHMGQDINDINLELQSSN